MNAWYRTSELLSRLESLNSLAQNPFISPLKVVESPTDVALYLVCLHYDACLDDSIEMAKKWKGLQLLYHYYHYYIPYL